MCDKTHCCKNTNEYESSPIHTNLKRSSAALKTVHLQFELDIRQLLLKTLVFRDKCGNRFPIGINGPVQRVPCFLIRVRSQYDHTDCRTIQMGTIALVGTAVLVIGVKSK